MTWKNGGGAASAKVNLDSAIAAMMKELKALDEKHAHGGAGNGYGKDCQRLARKLRNQYLNTAHNDSDEIKLSVNTLSSYLQAMRRRLREAGHRHPALLTRRVIMPVDTAGNVRKSFTLQGVLKQYPDHSALFEPLRTVDAREIKLYKKQLQRQLRQDSSIPKTEQTKLLGILEGLAVEHPLVSALRLETEEKHHESTIRERNFSKKALAPTELSYQGILKLITDGLSSGVVGRVAFALALASGRRAVEIVSMGDFEQVAPNQVRFTGQAKKGYGIKTKPYNIYTLIPAADFVEAFRAFRTFKKVQAIERATEHLDNFDKNRMINRLVAMPFNDAAKLAMVDIGAARKVFEEGKRRFYARYVSSGLDVVFKDSRAIYARVCVDRFYDESRKTKPLMKLAFVKSLLGHGEVSTEGASDVEAYGSDYRAVINYDAFIIDYGAPDTAPILEPITIPAVREKQKIVVTEKQAQQIQLDLKKCAVLVRRYLKENPHRKATGKRGGMDTFHEKVVQWALLYPHRPITKTVLIKEIGANRELITLYLEVIRKPLNSYNKKRLTSTK